MSSRNDFSEGQRPRSILKSSHRSINHTVDFGEATLPNIYNNRIHVNADIERNMKRERSSVVSRRSNLGSVLEGGLPYYSNQPTKETEDLKL
mmetsp:Transcript_17485/g.16710  ORF Transcript_17485/g.16710 Transcript_17485/m.16710 type:complete len:92 (+) Transcript_17485:297-572(+)